jgi:HEAT repeat protein
MDAMTRLGVSSATVALAAVFFVPPVAVQGDLARRVNAAPDGLVKMQYAARPGICGDGRTFIADNTTGSRGYDVWFLEGMNFTTSTGDFTSRCAEGPVRLMLVVRDHRVIAVQPFVGPSSPATERPGTELGVVSASDVSRYLLDLAASGREDVARNGILAASIADSVRIAARLATMARNKSLASSVRESALKWVGRVGRREDDRDAIRVARTIAEDNDDDINVRERAIRVIGEDDNDSAYLRSLFPRLDEPTLRERIVRVVAENGTRSDMDWIRGIATNKNERVSIRERAVRVLADAGDSRSLRELYTQLDDATLRERVIRVMADIGDGETKRWLRDIVERSSESAAVRERAIRSLADAGDISYLQSAYKTLDDEGLRERVIRSVADAGGADAMTWLRNIVRDSRERSTLRERAVRSMADGGAPTSELISLYDSVSDRIVRDRLVNLLADRGDKAARDKLRSIASDDPDEDLRRRATRKLAER